MLSEKNRLIAAAALFWFSQFVYNPYFTPFLNAVGISASLSGAILGAYGLAQMLCSFPFSFLSDLVRKKRAFIVGGFFFFACAGLLMTFSTAPAAFLTARALTGAGAAIWSIYCANFAGALGPDFKGNSMAIMLACGNAGQLISFAAGSLFYDRIGMRGLLWLSFFSAVLGLAIFCTVCPRPAAQAVKATSKAPGLGAALLPILKSPLLWNCAGIAVIEQIIVYGTSLAFTAEYASGLGASSTELAMLSACFTVGGLISSALLGRGKEYSAKLICLVSFAMMVVGNTVIPYSKTVGILYVCQFLIGFGRSASISVLMGHIVASMAPQMRSTALSLFQSLYSIGTTAGPVITGALLERFADFLVPYWAMTVLGVIGMAWIAVLSFGAARRKN